MVERRIVPFVAITAFWATVGIIFPILAHFFMRGSPNKGIVQIMFMMTAACCYLFWLCAFLFQLNPLLGPALDSELIRVMMSEWQKIEY